jgi:hypothetical protein
VKTITLVCQHCGKKFQRKPGKAKYLAKKGLKTFCGKGCFGLQRRKNKTLQEKKAEKRAYDMEYRAKNRAMLKVKKAAYYQRTHDPVKEAKIRKARMHLHLEYCRQPKYKAWKKEYDRQYQAKTGYGDFWESFLLLLDIEREIATRMDKYDIYLSRGYYNKTQHRRREYEKLNSTKSENCPLGNP